MDGLKRARAKSGLTQKQVADAVGITQNYYCEIEKKRKNNPSIVLLPKLAAVLGCTVDELLGGEKNDK